MGKRRFIWLVLIASALVFVACGGTSRTENRPAGIMVVDDAGRTVTLARPAEKLVSLAPSNTELLYALGVGAKVVAVDDYSNYPEEAKAKEHVGGFSKTNVEKVVSLGPDLVLATNIHAKAIVPALEAQGIVVIVIQPKNIEAVLDSIDIVGKLTGTTPKASDLAKSLRARLEGAVDRGKRSTARPRVYFELGEGMFTVGPGSFVDDMISKVGGQNIAGDAKTEWPQLNQETLVMKDPEIIILSDYGQADAPGKVKQRPGWHGLTAVAKDRVVAMNADLLNRPGPRVFEGLEMLGKVIQPELFR